MRYSLPLMLTVMLALAGCEKNGENAEDAAANAALAKSTAVSHGEIAAPPGFNEAINSGKPVLVDFYADWWGPCKTLAPTIDKIAAEYDGRAVVFKVDVDQYGELAQHYQVSVIPSVNFFQSGSLRGDSVVGARGQDFYASRLDSLLQ